MSRPANSEPLKFPRRTGPDRVLIIGAGLAGLFAALRLAPLLVTILSPRPLGQGAASAWAQGGIAAAMGEGDTPERHAEDTIAAGAGLSDPEIAKLLAREAPDRIADLLRYGVPFDRDLEGKLRLSQEAAHSARRIVRVNGDRAGKAVMAALIAAVAATPSITVLEGTEAVELVQGGGRIIGVYARRTASPSLASFIGARAIILATGGIGHLYRVTTNPEEANGGGLAMAARAGAVIADPEFVQFHPTALDAGRDPAPLLSEAIRGDGALLINKGGERFMLDAHSAAELAPRDVVARAVHREIVEGRGAFLDCRTLHLEKAFPTAFEACQAAGINPKNVPVPIAPAAHYHMGGVLTDVWGRTTLTGLWACGEAASTGVHGANRLASNSLLEAVVFAARAAEDIKARAAHWRALGESAAPESVALPPEGGATHKKRRIRQIMAAQVGVERSEQSLAAALCALGALEEARPPVTLRNMLTVASLVASAAHVRRESRGAHCRLDYQGQLEPRQTYLTLREARAIADSVTAGKPEREAAGLPDLRAAV
jgi:L-aspartate oxidase